MVRPWFAQFFLIASLVQKASGAVSRRRRSTTGKYLRIVKKRTKKRIDRRRTIHDCDVDGSQWVFDDLQTYIFTLLLSRLLSSSIAKKIVYHSTMNTQIVLKFLKLKDLNGRNSDEKIVK